MALVTLSLKQGTSKNNQPFYMATVVAQKYKSEPIFISELEFDYLSDLLKEEDLALNLENEQ